MQSLVKRCGSCKQYKPLGDFYNLKSSRDGKGYRCKPCDDKAKRKWIKENPEKFQESQRRNNLKQKYGITLEEYYLLLAYQGGVCAICGTDKNCYENKGAGGLVDNFAVDHCHETGKVRGLLCNQCNRGLGMLGDSLENLKKAYEYLQKCR